MPATDTPPVKSSKTPLNARRTASNVMAISAVAVGVGGALTVVLGLPVDPVLAVAIVFVAVVALSFGAASIDPAVDQRAWA